MTTILPHFPRAPTGQHVDHPLPAYLSAVRRGRRQPCESGGLHSGDLAEIGHLRDLALQQLEKLVSQVLDRIGRAVFPQAGHDLLLRAFAHLDKLFVLGRAAFRSAVSLRAKCREAGDQFSVAPVVWLTNPTGLPVHPCQTHVSSIQKDEKSQWAGARYAKPTSFSRIYCRLEASK